MARLGGVFSVLCFARWRVGDVHGALGHFFVFVRVLLVFVALAVSFAAAPEYLTTPRLPFHHVQHIPGHTNGSQHSFTGRRKQHW
jgi:hypothetical protein